MQKKQKKKSSDFSGSYKQMLEYEIAEFKREIEGLKERISHLEGASLGDTVRFKNVLEHIAKKGRCKDPQGCAEEGLMKPIPDVFNDEPAKPPVVKTEEVISDYGAFQHAPFDMKIFYWSKYAQEWRGSITLRSMTDLGYYLQQGALWWCATPPSPKIINLKAKG